MDTRPRPGATPASAAGAVVLAPCVAIVGPPNSGKTTLVHRLDAALARHPALPLAYVVPGSPDGTGRYQFHAPDLRDRLKDRVKGAWRPETRQTITFWLRAARQHLELVLLDLGGRIHRDDGPILAQCTHFIALARPDAGEREASEGLRLWSGVCESSGMRPLALLHSVGDGPAGAARRPDGVIAGSFRGDCSRPEDETNDAIVALLVETLVALRLRRPQPPGYIDLRRGRDWNEGDLADLAGSATVIEETARARRPVWLGGKAPLWAYVAALHRALDVDPHVVVAVFDPKLAAERTPEFVLVPHTLGEPAPDPVPVSLKWREDDHGAMLDIVVSTPDHFLPPELAQHPEMLPAPPEPIPTGALVVSGRLPYWAHLCYSRWLRARCANRPLGVWYATKETAVLVTGVKPRMCSWPLPPNM